MKKAFPPKTPTEVWHALKPWGIFIVAFLFLRYTGALSGMSYLTSSALMKTGMMDIRPEAPSVAKKFDYNFNLKDLEGNVVDVNDFKGKTIFLNIWATWCGPCRVEMPSIQNLYSKVNQENVRFVMLAVDRREDFEKVKNFISEKKYTFPVYTPASSLPDQLQVGTIPTTFVINPEGKIVSKEVGAGNYDTPEFKDFLENLLKP